MENKKAILFIDGDNVNKYNEETYKNIFKMASNYGRVTEAHIFVNKQSAKNEKLFDGVTKYAMHLHVLPIEKNSTDISLTIRATEKLYTDDSFEVYIIVTNDHDFMPLAIEIRHHNKHAVCFYTDKTNKKQLPAFNSSEQLNAENEKTAATEKVKAPSSASVADKKPAETMKVNNAKKPLKSKTDANLKVSNTNGSAVTEDFAKSVKSCFKFTNRNICYIKKLEEFMMDAGIDFTVYNIPLKDLIALLFENYPEIFADYTLKLDHKKERILKNRKKQ